MIKKLPQAPKSKLKFWLLIIGLPLIPVAIFAFMLFYQGSSDDIVRVANQFKPDPSWELVDETVNPPQIICLASTCPQVTRAWIVPRGSDGDATLKEVLLASQLLFDINGDCTLSNANGLVPVCDVNGLVDGYSVSVTYWRDSVAMSESKIVLQVEK